MNTCTSTAQPEREPSKFEVAAPIVRLWLLRLLVPLGAHKKFIAGIARFEKIDELLTDLEYWIEQGEDDEFDRKSTLKELTKLHRAANKKELAEDWIIQALELEHWIEQVENNEFDRKSALKELSKLHKAAEKELKDAKVPDPIANKIKGIAKLAKLSEIDCRILELIMLLKNERSLECAFDNVDPLNDLWGQHLQDDVSVLSAFLSVLLALPQDEIRLSLGKNGTLTKNLGLGEAGRVKTIWNVLRWVWRYYREKVRKAQFNRCAI